MVFVDFADLIARRVAAEHRTLSERWFERLLELLPVDARDVFPTASLLDHIPALILEISEYLRQPEDAIAANTAILDKARELGALRHEQRASLHQVLREYQLLGAVLVHFVREETERTPGLIPAAEAVPLVSRLHQAVAVLSQATVETFVSLYIDTIEDQKQRLEEFTRMAAHEWRQPLGALQFGVGLLRRGDMDAAFQDRTWAAVERNVQRLVDLTRKLEIVARLHDGNDNPIIQEVSLATIAREAARQLRDMADARGVDVRIADDLPVATVDVGRLELMFVNLLSNAIKYSDTSKSERWVEIVRVGEGTDWSDLLVRDNGVGIPADALPSIFQRFTRAHTTRRDLGHVGGIGLGLAIVEDCIRALGGDISVESREGEGTAFSIRLPLQPRVRQAAG